MIWIAEVAIAVALAATAPQSDAAAGVNAHLEKTIALRNQRQYSDATREALLAVSEAEKLGIASLLNRALAELARTYIADRNYPEAEAAALRAASTAQADGVPPAQQALRWGLVGDARALAGRFNDAEDAFRTALRIESAIPVPAPQAGLNALRLARALEAQARYDEAEKQYRESLVAREAALGSESVLVAESLNALAELLRFRRRRYGEAEPLHRRALAIEEKAHGPASPTVGTFANNLALDVMNLGRLDEAEALLLRAIDIAEKSSTAEGAPASRFLGNLAGVYMRRQQFAEAEKIVERSIALRERTFAPDSPALTSELNILARVYRAERRFADAERINRRILAIDEKAYGPDHPSLTGDRVSLGAILTDMKRFGDAEALFQVALASATKRAGPNAVEVANIQEAAAASYRLAGRYSASEAMYRQALATFEAQSPKNAQALSTLRNNYAVLLREEGRFREAIEQLEIVMGYGHADDSAAPPANLGDLYRREGYYGKAEALITRAIDDLSGVTSSAVTLQRLARVDCDRGRFARALSQLQQALVLADKSGDPDIRASVLEDLGNVRRELREYAEAARLYADAMVIREREDRDTPALGQLLENVALLAMRQGHLMEAESPLLRARRIYEHTLPAENAYLAQCLGRLATLYREQKRIEEAERLFKRSIELHEKTMTPGAPVLATTLTEYARLLRSQNRAREASELENRASQLRIKTT